ncbi:MarR family transcriptional regulator [Metabacillus sp. GX 13764]|uniref:MarR family winged helix-turn-helix transcriptional regulator n=1 Tax=Metabacillus kandeliae TaxID=2900151 RepID=UPI001E498F2F|nr:MarR family transcriptional regulator [Metabacillus kandeliae]MCD7032850.1 MarR family transcriptional regulator [Metabacillus kandeliae]
MEESNVKTAGTAVADIEKALRHISGMIKQKGREILGDYAITPPQFVALQWLLEQGDMTIGELSNRMFLACSTTTDLVDRMEKKLLVQRVKDESDRRVVRIHLLDEGERIIADAIEKRRHYLRGILVHFNSEELQSLEMLLNRLQLEMHEE